MKKLLMFGFAVSIVLLTSCGSEEKTLDGTIEHFKEQGFEIGERDDQLYEMIGANDGFSIELGDESVEFYKYDSGSEDLKEIQSNEKYDMGEMTVSAIANGSIVMMSYDDHPKKEKIVETFKSY